MDGIKKPDSLEQKEITDAIDNLQKGCDAVGTCSVHAPLSNAMVLNLRIGEQLIYKVNQLSKEKEDDSWLGSFDFRKGARKASGLVAIVIIVSFTIGATFCIMKWGPGLFKPFTSQPTKTLTEKVN